MDETAAPEAPPDPPAAHRRPLWPVVAALTLVVVALAVTLVVVRGQDERPRAEAGDVFDVPFQEDPLPHLGEVLLPWARTQVGVSEPRAELPDVLGAEPTVRAPEGGSFVRVEASLADDFAIPLAAVAAPFTERTEVVLRADGRDYPLSVPGGLELDPNGPFDQGGSIWVAVAGDPSDMEVRVTVDEVTQVVAADGSVEAGPAAGLADLPTPEDLQDFSAIECGKPQRLDDTALSVRYRPGLRCRVQLVLHTPYVDGIGWAEAGREFVVVHVARPRRLSLATGKGDATTYWNSDLRFEARLGDLEPVAPPVDVNELSQGTFSISDPENPQQVVFDVPADQPTGDLTLDLVADARRGDPFVTERRQLRFAWTVAGGELA